MPIKPIDLEAFAGKAANVHEAIVAASRRARQVNDEIKIEFNQRIETLGARPESETEENEVNPDQLKVSLEFERRPKPTDIALEELMDGRVHWRYREREQPPQPEETGEASAEEGEEQEPEPEGEK
ncbi:MAG: DNA-directed RNA polymerase subunit omega [Bacteroidota bacterium]